MSKPLINLPPDIKETPSPTPLSTGKPTKEQTNAQNYFAKHGRMPEAKQQKLEGTASFTLKKVPRELLADIALICDKHFRPENDRIKDKTIGSFIMDCATDAVNRYKKKFPKYWESEFNEEKKEP